MANDARLTVYDIATEIRALNELIEMDAGEITEAHEELMTQVYDLCASKTDNVCAWVKHQEDQIDLADKKIKELQEFKKFRNNAIERVKNYAGDALQHAGTKKFRGEIYEIVERAPVPVLEILNEDDVPVEFTTVETAIKIDKTALKKAVKEGKVDHPSIGLIPGKRSIQFKMKSVKQ